MREKTDGMTVTE